MVEFESSSGNGLETPRATQLAKIASRMKMSNGLRGVLRKENRIYQMDREKESERTSEGSYELNEWLFGRKGYFHSTIDRAARLIGLLSLRQYKALGARCTWLLPWT